MEQQLAPNRGGRVGRWYLGFVVCSIFGLAAAFGGSNLSHRSPVVVPPVPPDYAMPGKPLPKNAMCYYSSYPYGDSIYCRIKTEEMKLFISYSPMEGKIACTYVEIQGQTVGGLIAAWGPPTAIKPSAFGKQILWGDRTVYTWTSSFTPYSPVTYITYGLETDHDMKPWSGFADSKGD